MSNIVWEKNTEEKFKAMLEKIPIFMRPIAQEKVTKKAESIARGANRAAVNEKDMVDAFFSETPGGFQGPMKADMETLGIDYQKYGYERDEWKNFFGMKPK
ncbi:MAG: hypothetical protein A2787_00920 [Omnitrophica WOR_2 bacterium RIFCSPHIGHO2_01_FULL_48_9]|nr:MAG: hypothetical protein A2787_00920 [Omnitrophica WOR_2 bacterium RIFCSPHIGHO2_01_FULL_48_9]